VACESLFCSIFRTFKELRMQLGVHVLFSATNFCTR
jgi:hypothetical protein